MTIPSDPEHRWWVEVAGANPFRVDEFRPSLIALLAFGPGREAIFAGTGFFIAATGEMGLALTAKHVLTEGIARAQRPMPTYASSSLFVPSTSTQPSIDPQRLKAVWMGAEHAGMLDVTHIGYNDTLDLACLVITPQAVNPPPLRPVSIPIDTAVPKGGDVVHMVSLDNMLVQERVPPTDQTGKGQMLLIHTRVSIRVGVVTGVFQNGLRQYHWPCFTTSIPAEPGMSGGFVMLPRHGEPIAACGVVCADFSADEARADMRQKGESIVASTWPALSLRAPDSIPSSPTTPTPTLYDFMRTGRIDEAVGGIGQVELRDAGDGNCAIGRRGGAA